MYQARASDSLEEYLKNLLKQSTKIIWRISGNEKDEYYFSSYDKGVISVKAESALAAAYGMNQMSIAYASGHLGDYLGEGKPRFPLRPLWVGSAGEVNFSPAMSVSLPHALTECFDQQNVHLFCRRVIELGCNAVVLGSMHTVSKVQRTNAIRDLQQFCQILHDYDLKVIFKPTLESKINLQKGIIQSPLNPGYGDWVQHQFSLLHKNIPCFDFIFWESSLLTPEFTQHTKAKDLPLSEIVIAEAKLLEAALPHGIGLVFYLPANSTLSAKQQSLWMNSLCDEVGKDTIISFSAVAGHYLHDHLPSHPFWEQLRISPDISETPLLPVVNVGSVSQGEGLWPSLPFDLFEKYYSQLNRHRFAGIMSVTNRLPKSGGLLDCALWTSGQLLWRNVPSSQLMATWFSAYRPDWNFALNLDILKSIRQMTIELSYLRSLMSESSQDQMTSEEHRVITDSLLMRLKELQMRVERSYRKHLKKNEMTSLFEYMQCFVRDAQRIVHQFMQNSNLSISHMSGNEDHQVSFWMPIYTGTSQGVQSPSKGTLLDEPRPGMEGSRMEAIFNENRLI